MVNRLRKVMKRKWEKKKVIKGDLTSAPLLGPIELKMTKVLL